MGETEYSKRRVRVDKSGINQKFRNSFCSAQNTSFLRRAITQRIFSENTNF